MKCYEAILVVGKERFSNVDMRVRVKGGGHVAQVYAIRQAIAKSLVAYYQKCAPRLPRDRQWQGGRGSPRFAMRRRSEPRWRRIFNAHAPWRRR